MATTIRVLLAAASLSVALAAQQPTPPLPRPTFRSGVDLVPLDVVVLDRNRRPVKGLRAEDFSITENDAPQTIVTFEEVDVPEPEADAPSWMREVAPDVVSNDIQMRRLVLIVLDDGNMGVDNGEPKSLRDVAHKVVDGLGPSDLAAVVYTWQGRVENFTSDRRKLRAAVEAFVPRGWGRAGPPLGCMLRPGGCAVDAISRVADVLRSAPGGRKLLVFISPQLRLGAEISERPDEFTGLEAIRTMFVNLQLANVSVYWYDPRGVFGGTVSTDSTDEIALAEATGGRRFRGTNAPEALVPQMFRESSAYYLLGYRTTHTKIDGRFRRIRVKVNRPGVEVRTRTGYFADKAPNKKASNRAPLQQVDQAIQHGFPVSDVTVRATTAAFAARGGRNAELLSVLALREPVSTEPAPVSTSRKRVEVVSAAFDMEGRSKGVHRQTVELTLRPGAERGSDYEVTSRMPVAPGRYEVRIAAVVDGRAGSVFTTVEVPQFAKAPLSLSGVVVEKRPAPLTSSRSLFADLLPVVPTAARVFGVREGAAAFLRVYQGGTRAPEPVTMTARVTDAHDVVRTTSTSRLASEAFAKSRAADFTWTLPTAQLTSGEYLLTLEAALGERRAAQHVRFRIE